MSTGDDPTLSRLREALKPYIRNRQEALRIRRILSLYIGSAIGGSGESIISPISLATPGRDGYVKAVPPDLSGVRKDYLLALQANIKAREEYERTVQGLSPANETDNDLRQRQQGETHVRSVSTYLDLLELQKRYEKLKVIKNLLRVLQKEEPAKQDYLSIDWVKQEANAADDLLPTYENQTTVDPSRNDAQSQLLMSRLEKAVLCASETVKREKGLLEELRAKRDLTETELAPKAQQSVRIRALTRTRDELVSWVEQQLAKVDGTENYSQTQPASQSADGMLGIEARKEEVERAYKDYLNVRQSIVDLLSDRRTVPKIEYQKEQGGFKDSESPEIKLEEPIRYASKALPYVTEHLIPATDAQKALLQQEGHLLNSLNNQMRAMNKELDRLAEESHLLANYPILALQPRFKDAVAALGGSKLSPSPISHKANPTEDLKLARHARAWTFAAGAAKKTLDADLVERLGRGEQHANAAEKTLGELQDLIGFDGDGNDGHNDHDLWNPNGSPITSGIWAGLDGKIGSSSMAH